MKSRGNFESNIKKSLTPLVALGIALSPAALHAEEDMNAVCGPLLSNPPPATAPGGTPNPQLQKLQYCQAAKSAQDGATADGAGWKVWSSVSVVCTHACTASFYGGPTSEYLCTGANVAGGGTDAAISKNFSSALTGLGGAGAGLAANQAANASAAQQAANQSGEDAAKQGTQAAPKKKDYGACLSAATAAQQAVTKYKSMQSNNDAVKSNLTAAQQNASASDSPPVSGDTGFHAAATAGAVAEGAPPSSENGGGTGSGSNGCGSSTPGAIMQCAVATDSNLPAFVTNPNYPKQFQRDAGMPIGDFLSKNGPPGPMMAAGMANGLPADQGAKVASAVSDLSQAVESAVGDGSGSGAAMYSSGGGGGSGDGAEAPPDMAAMMAGLMDQMNPNKKAEPQTTGVSAVIFANQNRTPAAVVEDRKLSIFDRVTYRYYFVGRRIVFGEGEIK